MKDFFKSLFLLFLASSAFLAGFYFGEEKVKTKIPDFQEDSDTEK